MTDDDLLALMVKVDPMTRRIPEGIRAIADAIEAAEEDRCIAVVLRWGELHEPHETVNARNAASKISRALQWGLPRKA